LAYHSGGLDFCGLLKEVEKISGIEWIRFVTAHPKDFSEPVIETLANLKKFCPCLHLPLQSGSNRILALMRRHYTKEEFLKKIKLTRALIPEVSFTTDLMVGFPTETDEDFSETLTMVEEIRFDFAYMFQYSPRPQTAALKIKPEVDPKVAHSRLEQLIKVQSRITKENTERLIGKEFLAMVEGSKGSQTLARTKTNKIVVLDNGEPQAEGEIIKVKIIGVRGWTLVGEEKKEAK
jgi:tRNA-2-methylthio-N6-dimethylallyladenosine synthase